MVQIEFKDWSIDNHIRQTYKECKKLIKDFNKYGRIEHVNIYEIDTNKLTVKHEFINMEDK